MRIDILAVLFRFEGWPSSHGSSCYDHLGDSGSLIVSAIAFHIVILVVVAVLVVVMVVSSSVLLCLSFLIPRVAVAHFQRTSIVVIGILAAAASCCRFHVVLQGCHGEQRAEINQHEHDQNSSNHIKRGTKWLSC